VEIPELRKNVSEQCGNQGEPRLMAGPRLWDAWDFMENLIKMDDDW
jgi:hypothetical protein